MGKRGTGVSMWGGWGDRTNISHSKTTWNMSEGAGKTDGRVFQKFLIGAENGLKARGEAKEGGSTVRTRGREKGGGQGGGVRERKKIWGVY